jgi:hypothetical protein
MKGVQKYVATQPLAGGREEEGGVGSRNGDRTERDVGEVDGGSRFNAG